MTTDRDLQAQPWALGIGLAGAALLLAGAAAAARRRPPAGRTGPMARLSKPGDEAEPGAPQTGEGLCPACSGRGIVEGRRCETCLGTGTVVVNVGDA